MSFTQEYQKKLTTADEAVKVVKSGDRLEYGWCVTTPVALDEALAKIGINQTNTNYFQSLMKMDFLWTIHKIFYNALRFGSVIGLKNGFLIHIFLHYLA